MSVHQTPAERRVPKIRRWRRSFAFAVCIIGVWSFSEGWAPRIWFLCLGYSCTVLVGDGMIAAHVVKGPPAKGARLCSWNINHVSGTRTFGLLLPYTQFNRISADGPFYWTWQSMVPIWVLAVIFIGVWWLRSRDVPVPKSACTVCRYDLTANESGYCPECGTPIPRPPSPTTPGT